MNKPTRLRTALAASTVLMSGLLFVAAPAQAQSLPDTGNVTAVTNGLTGGLPGSTNPTFNTSGAAGAQTLTVNLNDNRTLLNWGGTGFNVAAGNTVNFADARATTGVAGRTDNIAVLNRDMSGQLSNLYGMIKSDPNVAVYVLNSNGINFGPSSLVNTGSFFASTLDLTDTNFLNQPDLLAFSVLPFPARANGIKLAPGAQIHTTATSSTDGGRMGDLVLIGTTVFGNDAGALRTLTATNGNVGIIAAGAVTVQNAPGSPLSFTITRGSPESLATTLVDIAGNISGRSVTIATAKDGPGNLGQGIQLDGTLTATGAAVTDRGVVLTAGRDAPGVTMAASFNRADPGSYIQLLGSIDSASGVTVRSGDGISMSKSLLAAGTVVTDGSFLNSYGDITGSDITLPYRTYVAGKTTATNGNIAILAGGGGSNTGGVTLIGGAEATGDITANTGDFSSGDLVAGGKIDLSVASGTFTGKVHATGPITMDLPSIYFTLAFSGDVTSDSDIHLSSLGHLTGGRFSAGGSLYLQGDSNLTASDVSGVNGVTLISDGHPQAFSIYDNGRIRINSVSTGSNSDVYIRGLQLYGTNDGRAGSLVAGRNIEVNTAFIDAAAIKGLTGSVTLTATTPVFANFNYIRVDDLFAGTTLAATSTGGLTIENATAQAGDMTLTGTSALLGSTTVSSNLIVGGNLTINSSGNVQLRGNFAGGGDLNVTGTNVVVGNGGVPGAQIRARGAINLTSTTSSVLGLGNVLVQSNSDGLGSEALTLSSATLVSFSLGTSLLGGTAQQSDIRIRSSNTGTLQFGDISARSLLGATGSDPFTNGVTRNNSVSFRGSVNLINSLFAQGTGILISGPISVAAGDIDLRSANPTTIGGPLNASGDISVRTTNGNLTLATGKSLTGRNVMLSTPAGFINNAGSGAINASGHWVIYSADPTGDTFGGLDSGNTALWNATLATRDPSTISGNRYVFALQPTLTFATQNFSKVYGTDLTGSNTVPFAVTGYQPGIAGAFLADTAATAFSGTPLITSPGFATHATVAGGPYILSISGGTLQSDAGYTLAFNALGQLTITPKELTGLITADTKTYDGTTAATGSMTLNGIVSGDVVGTTGSSFAFADKNAGVGKTVNVSGTTLTGADAGNYTLTIPATALADILKAVLTGNVTVNTKTYDGTTAATGGVTLNGVIAGDSVGTSGTAFAFADKNAGTGKTVRLTGTTLTGTDAGNYTLTIPSSALADILKAALTGTVTANNKTYDGTTTGSGSVALNGVIAGDIVGTGGTTFTFSDKNAGTGKTVTINGTTLTGTDAGNYTLTVPASALADILKKALTGTVTINGKTYDGTTAATGSVALAGVVSGDAIGTSGTVLTFADKNAGTGKTVAVSGTALTGMDAGNYTLSLSASALGDIARRVIALTADNLSKTQGASDPLFTYTINSGSLVTGDTFSGALTRATGELPGPYAITQGSLSASSNYTLNFTPGTLTINLDPVTQQPQSLRALTLPSQIQAQTASSSGVTLDQQDLCGDDKTCVVK